VETPQRSYPAVVERGALARVPEYLPAKHGKVFVISTEDVRRHQGEHARRALASVPHEVLFLPGGEERKRLTYIEELAEQMVQRGADRTSVVIAFGGGIVGDMAGFLASVFMRGIPVVQVPTTLLAQVDAAIGGKTAVNLTSGKNLVGTFHQPLAVLIDLGLLDTLPDREYRAGLYEIVKAAIIRDLPPFRYLAEHASAVLARTPAAVDYIIADAVRMKAHVVSADEREGGLRRILNFGHTIGLALEADTAYTRFLHGEAVAFGMRAAIHLSRLAGHLSAEDAVDMLDLIAAYGPVPSLEGITPERLLERLVSDKKTVQGKVHFVLPDRIGSARVVSGLEDRVVLEAIRIALA
jgi:3-dehydroquinate synthase